MPAYLNLSVVRVQTKIFNHLYMLGTYPAVMGYNNVGGTETLSSSLEVGVDIVHVQLLILTSHQKFASPRFSSATYPRNSASLGLCSGPTSAYMCLRVCRHLVRLSVFSFWSNCVCSRSASRAAQCAWKRAQISTKRIDSGKNISLI